MRRLIRDGKVSDKDIYLGIYAAEELDLNVTYEALLDHVIGETNYGPALIMRAQKLLKSPIPTEAGSKESEANLRRTLSSDSDLPEAENAVSHRRKAEALMKADN